MPLLNGDSSNRSQHQRGGSSVSSDPTPRSISTLNTSTSSSPAHPQTTSVQSGSGSSLLSPPSGSAFLSLSPASASSLNSLQGLVPPPSAPHTPPLPHSAPLSRALTPVPPSAFSPPAFNPLLLRAADIYATSTLPLPRKQPNEMQLGIMGNYSNLEIFLILFFLALQLKFVCFLFSLRFHPTPCSPSLSPTPCGGTVLSLAQL